MHGPVSGFPLESFTHSVRKLNLVILIENIHETLNVGVPKMFRCIFWKKNRLFKISQTSTVTVQHPNCFYFVR